MAIDYLIQLYNVIQNKHQIKWMELNSKALCWPPWPKCPRLNIFNLTLCLQMSRPPMLSHDSFILHSSQGTIWSHMTLNPRDTPPTHHRLISIKTLIPGSSRVPRVALRWETFFVRELQTSIFLSVALEILCLWTKSDISFAFFSLCLQTESVGGELS